MEKMASASALRDFAWKKLSEAKQKGTTLATATAATAVSTIASNVPTMPAMPNMPTMPTMPAMPTKTSLVFRTSTAAERQAAAAPSSSSMTLEQKREKLSMVNERANDAARGSLTGHASDTYSDSIAKVDLINESLAFTIDNIQECAHVMKLLNRQLRDNAAMQTNGSLHRQQEELAAAALS